MTSKGTTLDTGQDEEEENEQQQRNYEGSDKEHEGSDKEHEAGTPRSCRSLPEEGLRQSLSPEISLRGERSGSKDTPLKIGRKKYKKGVYRGVRERGKGRWVAEVKDSVTGCRKWLGTFNTPEAAALAFDEAVRDIRGPGARTNFPQASQTHSSSSLPAVPPLQTGAILSSSPSPHAGHGVSMPVLPLNSLPPTAELTGMMPQVDMGASGSQLIIGPSTGALTVDRVQQRIAATAEAAAAATLMRNFATTEQSVRQNTQQPVRQESVDRDHFSGGTSHVQSGLHARSSAGAEQAPSPALGLSDQSFGCMDSLERVLGSSIIATLSELVAVAGYTAAAAVAAGGSICGSSSSGSNVLTAFPVLPPSHICVPDIPDSSNLVWYPPPHPSLPPPPPAAAAAATPSGPEPGSHYPTVFQAPPPCGPMSPTPVRAQPEGIVNELNPPLQETDPVVELTLDMIEDILMDG